MLEWKVQVQPSACMCAWLALFWTQGGKRHIAKAATPELAVAAVVAMAGPDDKPMRRNCR